MVALLFDRFNLTGKFLVNFYRCKVFDRVVAAIAPWFHLRLPSCGPGFESQAHHLCFFSICIEILMRKERKINKKRPGLAHFFQKKYLIVLTHGGLQWYEMNINQIGPMAEHLWNVAMREVAYNLLSHYERNSLPLGLILL